jgi:hypothetical protein
LVRCGVAAQTEPSAASALAASNVEVSNPVEGDERKFVDHDADE